MQSLNLDFNGLTTTRLGEAYDILVKFVEEYLPDMQLYDEPFSQTIYQAMFSIGDELEKRLGN